MTHRDYVALWLATNYAVAAGDKEPWNWASQNADAFLDQADLPWVQKEVEEEMAQLDAADEAAAALAAICIGPPPAADAPLAEQETYLNAYLDLFAGPRHGCRTDDDGPRRAAPPIEGQDL